MRRVNMERSIQQARKKSNCSWVYCPVSVVTLRAVDELPDELNIQLYSIHYSWGGGVMIQ